jgi:hypothetical protein
MEAATPPMGARTQRRSAQGATPLAGGASAAKRTPLSTPRVRGGGGSVGMAGAFAKPVPSTASWGCLLGSGDELLRPTRTWADAPSPPSLQSALTPNDDAAEKAAARKRRWGGRGLERGLGGARGAGAGRRGPYGPASAAGAGPARRRAAADAPPTHRQADRMRRSLAGAFGEGEGGGGGGGAAARRHAGGLSEEELRTMLDLALKLAAENKITDRNVWALPLIDHLPDMVQHAAPEAADGGGDGGGAGGNYFTRISGGLDAGVQIYSKRVDATWKLALSQLYGAPQVEGAPARLCGAACGRRKAVPPATLTWP